MSNNDRFPIHASTLSMKEHRMFTDEYLVDPRQESWSHDAIEKNKIHYDYVTVSDQEIFEQMHPLVDKYDEESGRRHSGKSRGDCVETVLKSKIGEAYKGLQDPELAKMSGWQAKESVYDITTGVTYYFFKQKGGQDDEETNQPTG